MEISFTFFRINKSIVLFPPFSNFSLVLSPSLPLISLAPSPSAELRFYNYVRQASYTRSVALICLLFFFL